MFDWVRAYIHACVWLGLSLFTYFMIEYVRGEEDENFDLVDFGFCFITYYFISLAFKFRIAFIIWFFHIWISMFIEKVGEAIAEKRGYIDEEKYGVHLAHAVLPFVLFFLLAIANTPLSDVVAKISSDTPDHGVFYNFVRTWIGEYLPYFMQSPVWLLFLVFFAVTTLIIASYLYGLFFYGVTEFKRERGLIVFIVPFIAFTLFIFYTGYPFFDAFICLCVALTTDIVTYYFRLKEHERENFVIGGARQDDALWWVPILCLTFYAFVNIFIATGGAILFVLFFAILIIGLIIGGEEKK